MLVPAGAVNVRLKEPSAGLEPGGAVPTIPGLGHCACDEAVLANVHPWALPLGPHDSTVYASSARAELAPPSAATLARTTTNRRITREARASGLPALPPG